MSIPTKFRNRFFSLTYCLVSSCFKRFLLVCSIADFKMCSLFMSSPSFSSSPSSPYACFLNLSGVFKSERKEKIRTQLDFLTIIRPSTNSSDTFSSLHIFFLVVEFTSNFFKFSTFWSFSCSVSK